MRVHAIKHVPFEGPARIAEWARERGYSCTESLALTEEFPDPAAIALLLVMGGPMDAEDHRASPWLAAEKRYISRAAESGVPILGVCLGAQILAEIAGGRVRRNPEREIGWYPVSRTDAASQDALFTGFPDELVVGHWHGDTFDLPSGTDPLLSSAVCENQAFSIGQGRMLGLQFHLEWSAEALDGLVTACQEDLAVPGPHVASASTMREGFTRYAPACHDALWALLDGIALLSEEWQ